MRIRILSFFILLLLLTPTQGIFPYLKKAFDFVTAGNPLCQFGLTINSMVQLKLADPNSKLAVDMLKSLGEAFANHEKIFDHKMKQLHSDVYLQLTLTKDLIQKFEDYKLENEYHMKDVKSTLTLQFFQEKVNYPAHNLFMTATKYVNDQSNFTKGLLLNECLKHTPYTRLNDLDSMISEKWFLKQAELANYRLPDVETIRMHIYNVMKELLFSHFICMAIQGEPAEGSSVTDTVRSTVTNVIDTIDKELRIIESSFFPKYVIKEVQRLIGATTLPENDIKQRITIAEVTLNMLRKTYGPGIIVDSKNRSLFVRDYEVTVSKRLAFGKRPEEATCNIKVKNDYYVSVTRANRFGLGSDFDPDSYLRRLTVTYNKTRCYVKVSTPELFYEDVVILTFIGADDIIIRRPKKSSYPRLRTHHCANPMDITTAFLDPPNDLPPPASFELKKEEELMAIQDLKIAVQAELAAIKDRKNFCSSITSQYLVTLGSMVVCWTVLFSNNF